MRTLIANATIVNEGTTLKGHIIVLDDVIEKIVTDPQPPHGIYDQYVDAMGCVVMPGVIDSHVHFREPGLTAKADIASETRAAACGGVTTYFDMPNTQPQTVTIEALDEKFRLAAQSSVVNYSFFFGATNDNASLFKSLPQRDIPGIKLFMGSSTGNMLVDDEDALGKVFRLAGDMPVVAHCEDTVVINRQMAAAKAVHGDDPPVELHPTIRSAEACLNSSEKAVRLARRYGARLHVAHLSTAAELSLIPVYTEGEPLPDITAEAVVAHLLFSEEDYKSKGALVKCNPAVKTIADREALRKALTDGRILTIATDHAPHLLKEKQGGCARAASGMPMVQFSLPAMLELVDAGVLTLERMVRLMCHHPAMLFGVQRRGFLREGYKADIVIVRPHSPWQVTPQCIKSKCGWSPLMGHEFQWQVLHTFCNGRHIYDNGVLDQQARGERVAFDR